MRSSQTDAVASGAMVRFACWRRAIRKFLHSLAIRRRERTLRLCETLPLGEKRLLAVVQFEGRRFLIGATNQSISLLDRLDSAAGQRTKSEPDRESTFLSGVH